MLEIKIYGNKRSYSFAYAKSEVGKLLQELGLEYHFIEINNPNDYENNILSTPAFKIENQILYFDDSAIKSSLQIIKKYLFNLKKLNMKQEIVFDKSQNICSINVTRKPYRPLNVFRVFLKIGFSMMKESELNNYSKLRNILMNNFFDCDSSNFKLTGYRIPFFRSYYKYPIALLFKRKDNSERYASIVLIIYFGNSTYQIPLFSDDDFTHIDLNKDKMLSLTISPYLNPLVFEVSEGKLDLSYIDAIEESISLEKDLSSKELVKDEIESLTLFLDDIEFIEKIKAHN